MNPMNVPPVVRDLTVARHTSPRLQHPTANSAPSGRLLPVAVMVPRSSTFFTILLFVSKHF
jgi:hypothetical protein